MTWACDVLIIPALLMQNPGVTREEFIKLIVGARISGGAVIVTEKDPWDLDGLALGGHFGKRKESYEGLEGLAKMMGLRYTPAFRKFQNELCREAYGEYVIFEQYDPNIINPPTLKRFYPYFVNFPESDKKELEMFEDGKYKFIVRVHEKNVMSEPKTVLLDNPTRLKVGDIAEYGEGYYDWHTGFVVKILKEERHKGIPEYAQYWPDEYTPSGRIKKPKPMIFYTYEVEVSNLEQIIREEKFETEEELYKMWPQFHPDFMFDWSPEKGLFYSDYPRYLVKDMGWIRKGDRYYFDPENFDKMRGGFSESWAESYGDFGYTDLMCTSAAIKLNAWKLLANHGFDRTGSRGQYYKFLQDFPEGKAVVEKAIFDATTSLYAKKMGMTVNELIRLKNCGRYKELMEDFPKGRVAAENAIPDIKAPLYINEPSLTVTELIRQKITPPDAS